LRKLPLLLLPALVLVLALGLTACGGSESDEDKIVDVIETVTGSNDPADCERLATQRFLEQAELSKGPEAVKNCEENTEEDEDDEEEVEISAVKVDGSSASAEVAFTGGSFDGQTAAIELVEVDSDWKLDEITRFTKFDQDKLADAFEKRLQSGEDAIDPGLAECFSEVIREISEKEAEEIILGGSQKPIVEIFEGCQQGLEGAQ
jgi:hypothetical protein